MLFPLGEVIDTVMFAGVVAVTDGSTESTKVKRVRPLTNRLKDWSSGTVIFPPVIVPPDEVTAMVEPPTNGLTRSSCTSIVNDIDAPGKRWKPPHGPGKQVSNTGG